MQLGQSVHTKTCMWVGPPLVAMATTFGLRAESSRLPACLNICCTFAVYCLRDIHPLLFYLWCNPTSLAFLAVASAHSQMIASWVLLQCQVFLGSQCYVAEDSAKCCCTTAASENLNFPIATTTTFSFWLTSHFSTIIVLLVRPGPTKVILWHLLG